MRYVLACSIEGDDNIRRMKKIESCRDSRIMPHHKTQNPAPPVVGLNTYGG